MRVLVDGDPIVYRNGVAGELRQWDILVEKSDGRLEQGFFKRAAEAKAWLDELGEDWKLVSGDLVVDPLPVEFALAAVKRTLTDTRDEVAKTWKIPSKAVTMQIYLTGPGNFRELVAKEKPYKGNRDRSLRPYWYKEIREYLERHWGAIVVEGYEADDAISIEAHELLKAHVGYLVATVDKDLDQIPGPHYDYSKKVFYNIDPTDGMLFFYQQCISGDATDNIPGVWRMGKAKAEKAIAERGTDYFSVKREHSLERWLWDGVVDCYRQSMKQHPDKYIGTDPEAVALETARLVKMQEYEGQLWTPEGEPDESVESLTSAAEPSHHE